MVIDSFEGGLIWRKSVMREGVWYLLYKRRLMLTDDTKSVVRPVNRIKDLADE